MTKVAISDRELPVGDLIGGIHGVTVTEETPTITTGLEGQVGSLDQGTTSALVLALTFVALIAIARRSEDRGRGE